VNSTKQSKETWAKTEDRHSLVQSYFTTSGQGLLFQLWAHMGPQTRIPHGAR